MKPQYCIPCRFTMPTFRAVIFFTALIALGAHFTHAAVTEAWVQSYDGPGHKADYAHAVVMDHVGNVIVTGSFSNSTNDLFHSPEYRDIYTAKYAAKDGTLLWERIYNGPGNDYDAPSAIAVDKRGNVIVAGVSESAGVSSMYVAKHASTDGALLWEQRIGGQGSSVLISGGGVSAAQVDRHGDVFVAGGFRTGYAAKLTGASGKLLWESHTSSGHLECIKIDPRGNVFVAGSVDGVFVTAKHAGDDGGLIWEQRHVSGQASSLALDHRGNVVAAGSTIYAGGAGRSFYTAKYAGADGHLVWERSHHDPRGLLDMAVAVAVDKKGNAVVSGNVESQGDESNDMDFYTAKYAAGDGRILWEQTYDSPINGNDRVSAMAVDARGNVTVAGYAASIRYDGDLFIHDFYTTQYNGQSGKIRWEQQYDSEDHGDDRLAGLALGPNGEVAVTGYGSSPASGADFVTVVYRPKKFHQGSPKNPGKKPDDKGKDSKKP